MTITWEALFALASVIVFAIAAWRDKSLTAIGLALLALTIMWHVGVKVG